MIQRCDSSCCPPGCRSESVVSLPSSESQRFLSRLSQARRPSDGPIRRCGPSRRLVGPVLLELWWRSLSGPRLAARVRPLRTSDVIGDSGPSPGPACQRLASGSSVSSSLVQSRLVLASPARWRPSFGRHFSVVTVTAGPNRCFVFLRVDRFVTCECRSSCRVVVTGPLRGGTACFVRTH